MFLLGVAVFILLLFVASLYRIAVGPTIFDRAIGAGLLGTNAVLMLVLIGVLYERVDMFVDLALTYGMLNFIGVVALAKYFERNRESER
ncbi:MAG TPA: monovalent cation/H+ antiporter complex subunit F [Candidatus Binatia bacterium]|nr:monovalent cation/H+ antiporter complex subunit F [Candidatus Binatia bacterium]